MGYSMQNIGMVLVYKHPPPKKNPPKKMSRKHRQQNKCPWVRSEEELNVFGG